MTTDEALSRWTECRSVTERKGIYHPQDNWHSFARHLRGYEGVEEVAPGIVKLTTAGGAEHFAEVRG